MKKINAGKQLKILAVITAVIIIVGGIYLSYDYSLETKRDFYGYYSSSYTVRNDAKLIKGVLIFAAMAYIDFIMLFGFGELVETSAQNAENTEKILSAMKDTSENTQKLLEAETAIGENIEKILEAQEKKNQSVPMGQPF